MAEQPLTQQLAARFAALDKRGISAPVEILVGEYEFYPYRGFGDILQREDFKRLTQGQLRTLIQIADDIAAMQRPELFEAFVNDDGIIVINKDQLHPEYSVDVDYDDRRAQIDEIYPQVTFPYVKRKTAAADGFIRNDTAHEVAHHLDFWRQMESRSARMAYLHSSSRLLLWLTDLDRTLHPQGVAALVQAVRAVEGYDTRHLQDEGYGARKIAAMLRAEFFAIAVEFYYGSRQHFTTRSPLLEAYMTHVLDVDLAVQRLYIPLADMEKRRGKLRAAIHAPIYRILRDAMPRYRSLRQQFRVATDTVEKRRMTQEIEMLVANALAVLAAELRKTLRIPAGL